MARRDSSSPLWVLGLAASHNGAVCLLRDESVVAAVQEERLTGTKRERIRADCEVLGINYCLNVAGITLDQVDLAVVCAQGPRAWTINDFSAHRALNEAGVPLAQIGHHLGHAWHTFVASGFREAAILVIDGLGSPVEDLSPAERTAVIDDSRHAGEIVSLYWGQGSEIVPIEKFIVNGGQWLAMRPAGMSSFGSFGGMYSAASRQIFGSNEHAGKVMGLAARGTVTFHPDEFYRLVGNSLEFHCGVPDRFLCNHRWPKHGAEYANLAASVQFALEEGVLYLAGRLRSLTNGKALCYAGGVALNSVANERIINEAGFKDVYIVPAAEDSGTALGAAFHGVLRSRVRKHYRAIRNDEMGAPYGSEIREAVSAVPGVALQGSRDFLGATVERLCRGDICGWFEGGSELGPRALGHRSILCDPRRASAKKLLNERVKAREDFRPFAPAILLEEVAQWFDVQAENEPMIASPFMLRVMPISPAQAPLVPAVVHEDGTGRVQTVTRDNGLFWELLVRFYARTGVPILLNTSFNVSGEPIVETPEDALWCMLESGVDFCVLDGELVTRDGTVQSLLDLVPSVQGEVAGARSQETARGTAEVGAFKVRTRWGTRVVTIAPPALALLDQVDGQRSGWAIADIVLAQDDRLTSRSAIRLLAYLRRLGIVRLSPRTLIDTTQWP